MRSLLGRLRDAVGRPPFGLLAVLGLLAAAGLTLFPRHSRHTPIAPLPMLSAAVRASPTVVRDSLGRGETLSQIWERNGRPRTEMAAVVEAVDAAFDVRQLRVGTAIELYLAHAGGSTPGATGAVELPSVESASGEVPAGSRAALDSVLIRINADRSVAVRADGSRGFRSELRETPVREVHRTHIGCIESSLYAALTTRDEDFSLLALELDKIYGGLVDFYTDLQPGDCVSLSFQTFVRPDGSVRLGRIDSAELVNEGKRHVAIFFEAPDGTADYYDGEGKSLKRRFLRSPLKFTRISSGFALRRFHPILKRYRAHPGIDYAAPAGTPVQAAGDGVVASAGWQRGYGKTVRIRHGRVYETAYAHLSRIPREIRPGARVSQGEVIGYVGSTGLSTGPHLDYRFSKNGRLVNPLTESLPSAEPVAPQYVTLFAERRDHALERLEAAYRTALVEAAPEARTEASFGDD